MAVNYSENTPSQRSHTLSRIFICVGLTLATLWVAIGLINVVLVIRQTDEMRVGFDLLRPDDPQQAVMRAEIEKWRKLIG